jgi:hypothetical protein
MDWNSTCPNTSRVALAVIRYPAPVSVLDRRYGGLILVNPGDIPPTIPPIPCPIQALLF